MTQFDDFEYDYHLPVSVFSIDGAELGSIPCKVYLPNKLNVKPMLVFGNSEEDILPLKDNIIFSIECDFRNNLWKSVYIESKEVFVEEFKVKYGLGGLTHGRVIAAPTDLYVIEKFLEITEDVFSFTFWITPNPLLSPIETHSSSYTGEVCRKTFKKFRFEVEDGLSIVFENHFTKSNSNEKGFSQSAHLVGSISVLNNEESSKSVAEKLLLKINDLLLFASLSIRVRTVCMGWACWFNGVQSRFYKGDVIYPRISAESDSRSYLVNKNDFESFVSNCYQSFNELSIEYKESVRNAVNSLSPFDTNNLESSFLYRFSALESLLLSYRRANGLERIVENATWNNLKRKIRSVIKNNHEDIDVELRSLMYMKIEEINRVPLKRVFVSFCETYCIELGDLWPVFGNGDKCGLAEIRNKLIHGEYFPALTHRALDFAHENLRYVLERMVLRVLNYDVEQTNCSEFFLKKETIAVIEMEKELELITNYFNSLRKKSLN